MGPFRRNAEHAFIENTVPYSAGETLFSEGDAAEAMYAVQEGEVEIVAGDTVLDTLGADEIFGEIALVDKSPRSAGAHAKTDCKVVPIDEKQFQFLVQETPFFALKVMRLMAERLRLCRDGLDAVTKQRDLWQVWF